MNRTALLILGCGLVFGAPRPENSTYVDGNVAALKPNTGGTLVFSDDTAITFRTGLAEVAIPYKGISKAEAGATKQHARSDAPLYKVWALPQHFRHTETQLLTVLFKNDKGEDQTMTLELSKEGAGNVLAAIEGHTEAGAAAQAAAAKSKADDWWGDRYWKTTRNTDKWNNNGSVSSER